MIATSTGPHAVSRMLPTAYGTAVAERGQLAVGLVLQARSAAGHERRAGCEADDADEDAEADRVRARS